MEGSGGHMVAFMSDEGISLGRNPSLWAQYQIC